MKITRSTQNHPPSYYAATANPHTAYPALRENSQYDVCVIGGGYTGLAAALQAARHGFKVVLLEACRIGWGASGRNGGQLGSAYPILQPDLVTRYGKKKAHLLWNLTEEAKSHVKNLIKTHHIDCAYRDGNLGGAVTRSDLAYFQNHLRITNEYGYPHYQILDKNKMAEMTGTSLYCGGLFDPTAGHLHPLNLALGYAAACQKAGVKIFEMSPVTDLQTGSPAKIKVNNCKITADFILIGCNGYLGFLNRKMAKKILPADNYQLATAPLPDSLANSLLPTRCCVWDSHKQVYYYRLTPDNRLIFGGGVGIPLKRQANIASVVKKHMCKIYPKLKDVKIDYAWGGIFANTRTHMPCLGRVSENIFFAQGYTGHGVAFAAYAGKLMANLAYGQEDRFDLLAGLPHQNWPGSPAMRNAILRTGFIYLTLADAFRALRR